MNHPPSGVKHYRLLVIAEDSIDSMYTYDKQDSRARKIATIAVQCFSSLENAEGERYYLRAFFVCITKLWMRRLTFVVILCRLTGHLEEQPRNYP